MDAVFEQLRDALQLREVVSVDETPVALLHQLMKTPKHGLLMLR